MARIVVVQRETIDDLRDIRPSQRLAGTVQKWIALLDQGADELELMSLRLRAGHTDEALDYVGQGHHAGLDRFPRPGGSAAG